MLLIRISSKEGTEEDTVLLSFDIQVKSSFLLRVVSQGRVLEDRHTHQLAAIPVTFNASLA